MAVKTAAERAQDFLAGVFQHVPEDRREVVREALVTSPEALNYVAQGVLRQDEFSRHKDALATKQTELDTLIARNRTWYEENKPKVDRANAILEAGGGNDDDLPLDPAGGRRPVTPQVPALTKDELDQRVANSEQGAIKFFAKQNALVARHFREFGEVLDLEPLLNDPKLYQVGLESLYNDTFKDRYDAKAKATLDKQLADAKAAGAAEAEAAFHARLAAAGPYPTPHALAAASPTIETLKQIHTETGGDPSKLAERGFKNRFDEKAAAAEYHTLVQQSGG